MIICSVAEGEGTYNTKRATATRFFSVDFNIRRTLLLVGMLVWSSEASAAVITFNLDQFPDTSSVPSNAVLTEQYRDIGVLIDARSSGQPPGSLNAISAGSPGSRFFFFSPDIFGAIAIFSFVEPGTNNPTNATLFRATAGWEVGESVELVTFDQQDNQIDSMVIQSPNTSGGFQDGEVEITGLFHKVEMRTSGNPGIGFTNLQFELVSELPFYSINSKTGADDLVIIDSSDGSVTVVGSLGVSVGAADLAVLNDRLFLLRDGSNGADPQIPSLMEIAPSTGAVFSSVDLTGVGTENRAEGLATVSGQLVVAFSNAGTSSDTLGDLGLDGTITNTTGFSSDFNGLGADSAGNVFSTDQIFPPSSNSRLYAVDVGAPSLTNLNTIASVGLNDLAFSDSDRLFGIDVFVSGFTSSRLLREFDPSTGTEIGSVAYDSIFRLFGLAPTIASPDSDDDSMDDSWENHFFGDLSRDGNTDFDGDGMIDVAEFLAATDPLNNLSRFQITEISRSNDSVTITWESVEGRVYRVQYIADLSGTTWTDLGSDITATGTFSSETDDTLSGINQRFYRVILVP